MKDQTITGTYQGIPIACHKELDGTLQVKFQFQEPRVISLPPLTTQRVIKNRIDNLPQDILDAIAQSDIRRSELKRQQERDEKVCGKPFPKEEQYLEKRIKLQHYDSILKPKASSKEKEQEQRTNLILSPQDVHAVRALLPRLCPFLHGTDWRGVGWSGRRACRESPRGETLPSFPHLRCNREILSCCVKHPGSPESLPAVETQPCLKEAKQKAGLLSCFLHARFDFSGSIL